jgi:uncharacterized NAD(P)/FAD-binding protein YdhS
MKWSPSRSCGSTMQLGDASTEGLQKKDIYASGILTGWNSRQVSPAAVAWPKSFLLGREMECLYMVRRGRQC